MHIICTPPRHYPGFGVVVIGASNRIEDIDPAFMRRLARKFYVGYPNADQRAQILRCTVCVVQRFILCEDVCLFLWRWVFFVSIVNRFRRFFFCLPVLETYEHIYGYATRIISSP